MSEVEDLYPVRQWLPLVFYGDDESKARKHIVSEIMTHPAELISEYELRVMTEAAEGISTDMVFDQLEVLQSAGIITHVDGESYTYYGYTDRGKQFIVDSRLYRGEEVLKSVYHAMEKDEKHEEIYRTERPHHPPVHNTYEENNRDTDLWASAREQTFVELTIMVEHVGGDEFEAKVVLDGEDILDRKRFTVENAELRWDDGTREQSVTQSWGGLGDLNQYEVYVEDNGSIVNVNVGKNGEDWYSDAMIQRDIPIFRETSGDISSSR